MNDDTHAQLLDRLAKRRFANVSAEMRSELITFFSDANADYATKRNHKRWRKLRQDLQQLKASAGLPAVTAGALP